MEGTIERFYATGKRKESIAKVWVQAGKGEIIVNINPLKNIFAAKAWSVLSSIP